MSHHIAHHDAHSSPSIERGLRSTESRAETPPRAELVPEAAIAARAYQIFVGRGYAHGLDRQDWDQAKRELDGGQTYVHAASA